jgi:hypothetical protein
VKSKEQPIFLNTYIVQLVSVGHFGQNAIKPKKTGKNLKRWAEH